MTTEQEEFWRGQFGTDYTERNQVDWRERVPFWFRRIAEMHEHHGAFTASPSIMEVGCNVGTNLQAIKNVLPFVSMYGVEINSWARTEAIQTGISVLNMTASEVGQHFNASFDLVFTAGVLIHIPPEELMKAMASIAMASTKYVLAVEYDADQEEEVNYRGHANRLWKRPYGLIYEQLGLLPISSGDAGWGFDNCTYWLMRKP